MKQKMTAETEKTIKRERTIKPEMTMEELVDFVNQKEGEFVIQVSFGKGEQNGEREESLST